MADSYEKMVDELSNKLQVDSYRLLNSGSYYDSVHRVENIGLSTPPEMRTLAANIGWARMYVDSVEERLDVEGFRLAGESQTIERLTDWWQANGMDEESSMAHLDAMIYGRSYVTVAAPGKDDEPGVPLIRVESPLHVYAETDPRTRKVTRAVRTYHSDDDPLARWATLYLPNETVPLAYEGGHWVPDGPVVRHRLGVVPVVPIYNRERLSDRDGASEITPEIRSFTDAAARTMMNMQAAAELMAVPQRVLFGVNADDIAGDGTPAEIMDAYLARFIAIENDAAKAFQFDAAELRNYTDVLDQLAKHVASYTGLPPQYLSFQSDNPASAEAIKSSEARLVKKCERKARMFGGSWESVMRLSQKVIDKSVPVEMNRLETMWRDPATPTFASLADATAKLYANGMGIIPKERARIDLGYTTDEREEMKTWDKEDETARQEAEVTAIRNSLLGQDSQDKAKPEAKPAPKAA